MKGIYEDISYNSKNRNLEKVRLFFNFKEHSCDTLKHMPHSVFEEYLRMHMKDDITYDDVYKLIEMDYRSTSYNGGGLETNIFDYLKFYIDTSKLNRPPHFRHDSARNRDYDFAPIVKESLTKIFDTREGKIFLLAGIETTETETL